MLLFAIRDQFHSGSSLTSQMIGSLSSYITDTHNKFRFTSLAHPLLSNSTAAEFSLHQYSSALLTLELLKLVLLNLDYMSATLRLTLNLLYMVL